MFFVVVLLLFILFVIYLLFIMFVIVVYFRSTERQWQKVAPTVIVSERKDQFSAVVGDKLQNLPATCPKTASEINAILEDKNVAVSLVSVFL